MLLALTVLVAVAAPHSLRLEGVRPATAAAVWSSALLVRALACVYAALFIIFLLPGTQTFTVITRWCWHGVVPVLTTHLRLTGHGLADVALWTPVLALTVSLGWGAVALWRAARAVRCLLSTKSVGRGPGESVILGDGQVVIAAAGLRRPQLVVSAGALVALDDEELAAGLDHERGHIAHRHSFVLMAAEILGAVARFVPGTQHARQELLFHLERDADRYALERRHHPGSLASAICKAAESAFTTSTPALSLGGSSVVRRLHALLEDPGHVRTQTGLALVALLGLATIGLLALVALPSVAHAGADAATALAPWRPCPD